MAEANERSDLGDPHNLGRFVEAQEDDYQHAALRDPQRSEALALDVVHLPAV